ncbi:glycosyltransferase family 2 protein [Flavobacterium lipolyticum]|uniref:Glycosyltransferase family 2 protein n=1 Tax=Flavobacterium lipolyticum TaxID=2893754 RepID=A0ABS8LX47_9FLAO|nr:glycosyltransferase family 2 protein [Flavobacterium sp. F-126]MCC9017159.1 glycosyltransferase family 2 protein [Flavobacterium sp. F-126]
MEGVNVSVVIVNYNTVKMTNECIESLYKHTKNVNFEIILVDNASTDGSKDFFLKDERIRYFYLDKNIGFGRANNVGANESQGKYIFMLNSDTILLDDVISKLFNFAENHLDDDLGTVGTCLINSDKEDALSFGQFITSKRIYRRLLETLKIYKNKFEVETYTKLKEKGFLEVDFVSGADLFIPKTIFNQVGGFDRDFFMYYEETDLQKRISKLNLKRYIIDVRDIIHLEGGSFEEKLPFRRKMMMTKGMKLYINKHFKGIYKFQIITLSFLILVKDLIKLNYSNEQKLSLIKEVFK